MQSPVVRWSRSAALVLLLISGAHAVAAQEKPREPTSPTTSPVPAGQPPSSAAQEGFVPIGEIQPKEQLPAAPLLTTAYIVAWLAVFVYVWSIWQRLGRVEREIAEVSRRIAGGSRR